MFLGSIERDHSKKCVGVRERPAELNGLMKLIVQETWRQLILAEGKVEVEGQSLLFQR